MSSTDSVPQAASDSSDQPHNATAATHPRRLRRPSPVNTLVILVCTLLFVWPVLMVVIGAFRAGAPGLDTTWSLSGLTDAYARPSTRSTFLNSFAYGGVVTVLSLTAALTLSWVVARTDTPMRRLVTPVMLLTLAMPTLFFGIAWGLLGNESYGSLNRLFQAATGSNAAPINVESWPGLTLVTSLRTTAFMYFLTIGPFLAMDRTQEEAAMMAGASKRQVFTSIQLPALSPAVISTGILGVIIGLEYFELPLILGTPAGINVFSTEIYRQINAFDPPRYSEGSALSLLLIITLLVLLAIQNKILKGRLFATVTGKAVNQRPWALGRWKWLMCGVVVLYALLAVVLPFAQLAMGSFQPFLGIYQTFTLENYRLILDDAEVIEAVWRTMVLSVFGGGLAMTVAVGITFVLRHSPGLGATYLRLTTWLPWSIPGTALALGLLWAYLSVPLTAGLYGTVWLMLIGLIVVVTPIAMRNIEPAVDQISRDLEESAWTSGAGRLRAYVTITARLVWPSFISGWLLTGLLISGNLSIPLMLGSFDNATLPVVTYDLYNIGQAPQAAALFCLITAALAATWAPIAVLRSVVRWLRRRPRASSRAARAAHVLPRGETVEVPHHEKASA